MVTRHRCMLLLAGTLWLTRGLLLDVAAPSRHRHARLRVAFCAERDSEQRAQPLDADIAGIPAHVEPRQRHGCVDDLTGKSRGDRQAPRRARHLRHRRVGIPARVVVVSRVEQSRLVAGLLYMLSQAALSRWGSGQLNVAMAIALAPVLLWSWSQCLQRFTMRRALDAGIARDRHVADPARHGALRRAVHGALPVLRRSLRARRRARCATHSRRSPLRSRVALALNIYQILPDRHSDTDRSGCRLDSSSTATDRHPYAQRLPVAARFRPRDRLSRFHRTADVVLVPVPAVMGVLRGRKRCGGVRVPRTRMGARPPDDLPRRHGDCRGVSRQGLGPAVRRISTPGRSTTSRSSRTSAIPTAGSSSRRWHSGSWPGSPSIASWSADPRSLRAFAYRAAPESVAAGAFALVLVAAMLVQVAPTIATGLKTWEPPADEVQLLDSLRGARAGCRCDDSL